MEFRYRLDSDPPPPPPEPPPPPPPNQDWKEPGKPEKEDEQ